MLKSNQEKQLITVKETFFSKALGFFRGLFTLKKRQNAEATKPAAPIVTNTKKEEIFEMYAKVKEGQTDIDKLSEEHIDMLNALADEEIRIKEASIKEKLKELVIRENEVENLKKQIAQA